MATDDQVRLQKGDACERPSAALCWTEIKQELGVTSELKIGGGGCTEGRELGLASVCQGGKEAFHIRYPFYPTGGGSQQRRRGGTGCYLALGSTCFASWLSG